MQKQIFLRLAHKHIAWLATLTLQTQNQNPYFPKKIDINITQTVEQSLTPDSIYEK